MSTSIVFQKNKTAPKNNEHYTPEYILEPCIKMIDGFDLDPASCKIANERVKAGTYMTKDTDGLCRKWHGDVWCNPPYSNKGGVGAWVKKAAGEVESGRCRSVFLLLNSNTSSAWFHELVDVATICFIEKRIKFYDPSGNIQGNPAAGNILALISQDFQLHSTFTDQISDLGTIMRKCNG